MSRWLTFLSGSQTSPTWLPEWLRQVPVSVRLRLSPLRGDFNFRAGGLIFPPILDKVLRKYAFSNGVRVFTGIVAGLLLVACCLGLLIPAPTPQQSQQEQEGAKLETLPRPSKWVKMVRNNIPYMLYIASIGCIFAGYYPIVFHLGEWVAEKRHWAGGPSYSLIIIMNR